MANLNDADSAANGIVKGQEVSLGCGTLILIALIVMLFSNRAEEAGNKPVLEKLDAIERRLEAIETRLEQSTPPAAAPGSA